MAPAPDHPVDIVAFEGAFPDGARIAVDAAALHRAIDPGRALEPWLVHWARLLDLLPDLDLASPRHAPPGGIVALDAALLVAARETTPSAPAVLRRLESLRPV